MMLDCLSLEYKLCEVFDRLCDDERTKGFWCDGVDLSEDEEHYSKKFVNDNRHLYLMAWAGKAGEALYSVKLKFGRKALSRYARGLCILECFPIENKEDLVIDIERKIIEVQLR